MPNHPNRSRSGSRSANPDPEEIRKARDAAELTQAAAAELVHSTRERWAEWETGVHRMHPGLWELFRLKTGHR